MEDTAKSLDFRIETAETPEGDQVSFCTPRGGIITSIRFQGREALYLEKDTLENPKVNVRGGVPILFPNAGSLESSVYPNLRQHGFARTSSQWRSEKTERGFRETFVASEETREMYPYDFRLSIEARFEKDGSFSIVEEVENLGEDKEMPISMGLHPYFKVPHEKKGEIRFNFEEGTVAEQQAGLWENGTAVSIDNPKLRNPDAVMEVVIPLLGTLIIDASEAYRKIWIWSLPGKDFICIEPVMRNAGGLADDPERIKPRMTLSARVNFKLI